MIERGQLARSVIAILLVAAAGCGQPEGPVAKQDVAEVVEDLSSPKAKVRDAARVRLEQTDPFIAWGELEGLVRGAKGSSDGRLAALAVFEKGLEKIAFPPVILNVALGDPDPAVRAEAMRMVIANANPDHAEGLRLAAAKAEPPDREALETAHRALLDREWAWHRRIMSDARSTAEERALAARALGILARPADLPFLVEIFAVDTDPLVRMEILLAATQIGGPEASALVRMQLRTADPLLRAIAAQCEITLKDPESIPHLATILATDKIGDARVAAARALVAIGGADAKKAVEEGCKPPHMDWRIEQACGEARKALRSSAASRR